MNRHEAMGTDMQLTYFDAISGRKRVKRRYLWAFWSYLGGFASGLALMALLL